MKIFGGDGFSSATPRETIEDLSSTCGSRRMLPVARRDGRAARLEGFNGRYIVFVKNTFPRDLSMEGRRSPWTRLTGRPTRWQRRPFHRMGRGGGVPQTPDGFNINDQCGSQHSAA
jgi:phosphoglucosamine mutase